MNKSQLAINSVSTTGQTLEERLDAYAGAGFTNVEFALPHLKQGGPVARVRKLLDQYKLRCIGGFECPITCFGDPRSNDLVVANANLLAELGAKVMVAGTDGPAENVKEPDPIGRIINVFTDLNKTIEATGVTLCIEFNWSPVVKSLRTAVEIARRSGSGVLFDPAHYHCTPSKLEMINEESVPFIRHVHVDDMNDKPGELSDCNADRALPGQGCLDLKTIFGAIEKHGYNGYFSIEMFNDALWSMPAKDAARLMYQSMMPLCEA